MRITYLAGISFTLLIAMAWPQSAMAAKITEEDCTVLTAREVGVRDGARGAWKPTQGAKLYAKKCLKKYGVTFDKAEYLRGTRDGFRSFCTEETAIKHRNQYREPTPGCFAFDNPYADIFRLPDVRNSGGKFVKGVITSPKVSSPTRSKIPDARVGASSDDVAVMIEDAQALRNDAEQLKKFNENVDIYYKRGANSYVGLSDSGRRFAIRHLERRAEVLTSMANGQQFTVPTPMGRLPGPPDSAKRDYRSESSEPKMKKKACKAMLWDEAGYKQGAWGNTLEAGLQRDGKKCGRKISIDKTVYTAGYKRGLSEYCGYERGYLAGTQTHIEIPVCEGQGFSTYEKGKGHGTLRRPFLQAYDDANGQRAFLTMMSEQLGYVAVIKAGDERNAKFRRVRQARIEREGERLDTMKDVIKSFEFQYFKIDTGPATHGYVYADSELNYPIPD